MNYIHEIEKLYTKFSSDVQDIIDSYQENVLNPFCDRYKLNFYQGNGVWIFEDIYGKFDIQDCELSYKHSQRVCEFNTFSLHESRLGSDEVFKKELYAILEFINTEIHSQSYVQYGFNPYRTND